MFGATAAVYSVNRVSRSLWFFLNRMLLIPCGVFYDDFPMFSPEETALDADESTSELLDLLGWRRARTGPKGKPFESSFNVLGCSLNLERINLGEVVLENKQGRLERIFAQLEAIKSSGRMTLHSSPSAGLAWFASLFLWVLCWETHAASVHGSLTVRKVTFLSITWTLSRFLPLCIGLLEGLPTSQTECSLGG